MKTNVTKVKSAALLAILALLPVGCGGNSNLQNQMYNQMPPGMMATNQQYYNSYDNFNNPVNGQYMGGAMDVAPINNLPTGTIMGKVVDSLNKSGLGGVAVEVVGVRPPLLVTTDASGNFTLSNVPQGRQVLTVRRNDYTNVSSNSNIVIDVKAGSTSSIPNNIELVPFRASSVNGFIRAFNNFKLPRGIALAPGSNNLYVVDVVGAGGLSTYDHAEVKKLNGDGGVMDNFGARWWSKDLLNPIRQANGLGVDSGGNVLVASTGNDVIRRYGPGGQYVSSIKADFKEVFDVAVMTTGDFAVSDAGAGRVTIFDSSNTVKVPNILQGMSSTGVRGLTTNNNDDIFVLDATAPPGQVIRKFDRNGNRLPLSFGRIGGVQPGFFNNPTDLAIDNRNGDLYVVDSGNNRIQRFDSEGNYLSEFGSFGTDNGRFNAPWGVAVDNQGFVYITDSKNQRIQKFAPGRVEQMQTPLPQ